jgi:hypothetical protein
VRGWRPASLISRPRATRLLVGFALLSLATSCSMLSKSDDWSEAAVAEGDQGVQAMVINSQVVTGPTRLAFGLFASNGTLVQDATGKVRLYRLDANNKATAAGEHDLRAVSIHNPGGNDKTPLATMYVATADLGGKDWWGAELLVRAGGKQYQHLRTRFFVAEKSNVPAVGMPAPRTAQQTVRDVKDVAEIDSSAPPRPELHSMTVAEAIDRKQPTVVAWATPAFCQTRFCGPVVDEVVAPLSSFIHIEPYRLADARQGRLIPIPEMAQWGLASEPYIFVLDAKGNVAAQFEGITAKDEVAAVLERLLKS